MTPPRRMRDGWRSGEILPAIGAGAVSSIGRGGDILSEATGLFHTFGEVRVVPNPARTFRRGDPMYVYFQAYGLGLQEGRNSLREEYTFSRAGQALWKPSEINLLPTEKTERGIFFSFDTARFPPGQYTLVVKVDDLVRSRESRRALSFVME